MVLRGVEIPEPRADLKGVDVGEFGKAAVRGIGDRFRVRAKVMEAACSVLLDRPLRDMWDVVASVSWFDNANSAAIWDLLDGTYASLETMRTERVWETRQRKLT